MTDPSTLPPSGVAGQAPQGITLLTPADFDQEALQAAQAANLAWCEAWLATLPPVAGVPVARALTYDLIQFFNRSLIGDFFEIVPAEMPPEGVPPDKALPLVKDGD